MKAANQTKAHWWEKAIVCAIFAAAIFYARRAGAADQSAVCPPKAIQALARICMAQGDYDKAEVMTDRGLSTAKSDQEKSIYLIDLAWIYKNQGRFAQAEHSCLQGLQLQEQVYYAEHPYIAYTLRILGSIYQAQGDYGRAWESFDRAISIIRKCHSADDPVLASFETDVAHLLSAQGQFTQAEQQYERVIHVIIGYYGLDHLYTARVMSDLSKLYYLQGRLDEAQSLLDYSLDIQHKVYGDENPLLISSQVTMAKILRAKGDIEQTKHLLTNALVILEKHPSSYGLLQDEIRAILADIYVDSGSFAEVQSACNGIAGA